MFKQIFEYHTVTKLVKSGDKLRLDCIQESSWGLLHCYTQRRRRAFLGTMAIGIPEVEDFKHGSDDTWENVRWRSWRRKQKSIAKVIRDSEMSKCHVVRQVGSLILIKERNQGTVGAERQTEITSWRLERPQNSIVSERICPFPRGCE